MPYIKIRSGYRSKPKIRKYIELSGDRMAILPVASLLIAVDEQAQTGHIVISPGELERLGKWSGRRGEGVAAMVDAGLIRETVKGFEICDWEDEQGHILKDHLKAKKAAKARHKGVLVGATSNA